MRTFLTKDDVLTLLIHLGYLGYDTETGESFIPNKEIAGEFENAMRAGGWAGIVRILEASDQLLEDTLSGNVKRVAEGLERAHRGGVCPDISFSLCKQAEWNIRRSVFRNHNSSRFSSACPL